MLHAFFLQHTEAFKHLLRSKTVFRISRIIHDTVAYFKNTARVITAAHRFRKSAQDILQKFYMRNIIQIDGSAQLSGIGELLRRRIIGGKHDIFSGHPHRFAQHQLRQGRTVTAAAIIS